MNEAFSFPFEVKGLGESGAVEGVAAAYGNTDRNGDVFAPGVFAASVERLKRAGQTLPMLLHHDPRRVIGAWHDLAEVPGGLLVKGQVARQTRDGAEAYELLKLRALTGLSVGFRDIRREQKAGRRDIVSAELLEASLVAIPANPLAQVTAVKRASPPSHAELAELLRAQGFGGRAAKRAAAAAIEAAKGCASDDDDLAELAASIEQGRAVLAPLIKEFRL